MQQKELLTNLDVASVGEEISHELATEFVTSYQNANPGEVAGYTVGRNIIDQILAQPGCVGLRFYNALNEMGQKTLVYIGVDAAGKDIVKKVVVEEDGKLASHPAIVADRIFPWLIPGSTQPGINPGTFLPW